MIFKTVETGKRSWIMLLLIAVGAALAFMLSAGLSAGVASAYNDDGNLPCKWWHSANTDLEPEHRHHPLYAPTGRYLRAFNSGISNWDTSDTPVDFDYDTGQTAHTLGVDNIGSSGPYGWTEWRCWSLGKRSYTYTMINSGQVPSNAKWKVMLGVATHELGHHIGLSHSTHSPAVMDVRDDPGDVYNVKLDDECGVNDRYTHSSYPVDCNY